MAPQPGASLAIERARGGNQTPVLRRMVQPLEMYQFVDEDEVAHPFRHQHQPPVQADVAVAPARSPARPLIADRDVGDLQIQSCSKLAQARGELQPCPRLRSLHVFDGNPRSRKPRALSVDPGLMPDDERLRLAQRSPARNGHAHPAIMIHAQHIAASALVADEDGFDGGEGCRRRQRLGRRRTLIEWKAELHAAQDKPTRGCSTGRARLGVGRWDLGVALRFSPWQDGCSSVSPFLCGS